MCNYSDSYCFIMSCNLRLYPLIRFCMFSEHKTLIKSWIQQYCTSVCLNELTKWEGNQWILVNFGLSAPPTTSFSFFIFLFWHSTELVFMIWAFVQLTILLWALLGTLIAFNFLMDNLGGFGTYYLGFRTGTGI